MDAWFSTTWDIDECVGREEDDHVHIFFADVVKSFDTVDRLLLACTLQMSGCASNLWLVLVKLGLEMVASLKDARSVWFSL